MPIRLPVVLSPSRTETAARCHRRHFLANVVDRVKWVSGSLKFGTVMHKAVAEWWRTHNVASTLEVAESQWRELRPDGDNHSLEMARELVQGYIRNVAFAGPLSGEWSLAEIDGEPLLEHRLEVPIHGAVLSCQPDRVLEASDGRLALVDLKTSKRISRRWHDRFDYSLQMKLYRAALEISLGRSVTHVIIEGVEKSVPFDVTYHICPEWSEEELSEALRLWEHYAALDREVLERTDLSRGEVEEAAVRDTSFNYGACFDFGYRCPYFDLCTTSPEMRLSLLQSEYDIVEAEGY